MLETYKLSKKFGVSFKSDPVEFWLEKIKNMPFNMTSSMHVDFNNNKKLEIILKVKFVNLVSTKPSFSTNIIF